MFLKEFKFFLVYVIPQFCIKPKLMLWFYFSVLKFTLNLWVQEHIGTCGRWQSAPDKSYGFYCQLNSAFQLIKIISICWLKIFNHIASTCKHWFQCCAKEWGIFILPKCLFYKFESLDGKIWWWLQFLVSCPVSVQYINEIPAYFCCAWYIIVGMFISFWLLEKMCLGPLFTLKV